MHVTVRQKPATAGATHQAPGERSEPGVCRKTLQSCSAATQSTTPSNGQHLFSRGLLTTMHVTVRQKPATAGATHQAPGERSEPGVCRKTLQSCSAATQSTTPSNGQHLFSRGLLTTMHVTVRQKPATAGATHQAPGERSEPGVYRKLSQSCSAAAQSTNTTSKHEQYREGHRHTLITGIK